MKFIRSNWWILGLFAFCLLGMLVTPFEPYAQDFAELFGKGVTGAHLFGVDHLGQDVLSRVWLGAANTILYAFLASLGTMVLSAGVLLLDQVFGGFVSRLIQSIVSLGIAIPVMFLGLLFMFFMERSPLTVSLAIAIAGSPLAFRQLRVQWMEQRSMSYVEASRAIGGDRKHVLRFSIWPNLEPQIVELWKLVFAIAILELSALTFLGLVSDPNWAELGSLLRSHQKYLNTAPMLVVWPGVVLCGLLWSIRMLKAE